MHRITPFLAAITSLLLAGGAAHAAVISVNFSEKGESPLAASDSAGVAAATNWNNVTAGGTGATALNLKDNSGSATTADVTIAMTGSGSKSPDITPPVTDPDTRMLIDEVRAFRAGTYSVSLSEIPYAQYDVYVYFVDQSTTNSSLNRSITDGTTTYLFRTPVNDQSFFETNGFVRSTDTTAGGNNDIGNYVLFEDLTGTSKTLTLAIPDGGERVGVSGFQIVEVPEPASLALVGLGSLLIVGRRPRA